MSKSLHHWAQRGATEFCRVCRLQIGACWWNRNLKLLVPLLESKITASLDLTQRLFWLSAITLKILAHFSESRGVSNISQSVHLRTFNLNCLNEPLSNLNERCLRGYICSEAQRSVLSSLYKGGREGLLSYCSARCLIFSTSGGLRTINLLFFNYWVL